jgi:hypothetical protein
MTLIMRRFEPNSNQSTALYRIKGLKTLSRLAIDGLWLRNAQSSMPCEVLRLLKSMFPGRREAKPHLLAVITIPAPKASRTVSVIAALMGNGSIASVPVVMTAMRISV